MLDDKEGTRTPVQTKTRRLEMSTVKIVFFGLSIFLSGAALTSSAIEGNARIDTASYASPEGTGHVGDTASYAAPEGNGHVGDTASYAAPEGNGHIDVA